MLNIHIVGAGFSGLAAGALLAPKCRVTLFEDPQTPSASARASGLLHPFHGPFLHCKKSYPYAYQKALALLTHAQKYTHTPLMQQVHSKWGSGAIRAATSLNQQKVFFRQAKKFPNQLHLLPSSSTFPLGAVRISAAYSIDAPAYLAALKKCIQEKNGILLQKRWTRPSSDAITLFCTGWKTPLLFPQLRTHFTPVKGQLITYRRPNVPTPCLLQSGRYFVPCPWDSTLEIAGATYEHVFHDAHPRCNGFFAQLCVDAQNARDLRPLRHTISTYAGIRLATQGTPTIHQIDEKNWVMAGLGSHGLLLHAWLAEMWVKKIL